MNNLATTLINPAAACPEWCSSDHARDTLVPDRNGSWDALHIGTPAVVETVENLPLGVAVEVAVASESYACETPSECRPRVLWIASVDAWEDREAFAITARQALRLAEVLVQQASAVLAEETAETVGADR